jgi:hypothetical protein
MGKVSEMDAYHYANFVGDDDFLAFRSVLPVGSVAPDAAALELAGLQAVSDFQSAMERWASGKPLKGKIELPE